MKQVATKKKGKAGAGDLAKKLGFSSDDRRLKTVPLDWSEVSAALDPRATNLRTLRARLDARGDLAASLLSGTTRLEPALSALAALAPSRG